MPHSRRYFISNSVYAITFRVKEGLPFVANRTISNILKGCMARAQSGDKATLCHFLWMGNHVHMLVIIKDPYQLTQFYGEIMKKITDSMRRLFGKKHLILWEGRAVVAYLADLEAAIENIVYTYANPARANLERTITRYPGFNSWSYYQNSRQDDLNAEVKLDAKWVSATDIPALPTPRLSERSDKFFDQKIQTFGHKESLIIRPNAWMTCFGITDPKEVASTNQSIRRRLAERELELEQKRVAEGKAVYGARALAERSMKTPHTPAPCERRVFVIATDKEERISFIGHFKDICEICRECFELALQGCLVSWPPGCFRPSMRHAAAAITE